MALVNDRGRVLEMGAHVTAVAWTGEAPAFALGDGRALFVGDAEERAFAAHDGACLAAAAHPDGRSLLTGGDDGRLMRVDPEAGAALLFERKGAWIDRVAAGPSGAIAWAAGKRAWARADGQEYAFEAPSGVGGLAFAPKGMRLAVSHYNGVTLHWLGAGGEPLLLTWKGAHQGVTFSPDGRFVVTAMQENALHGWRLEDRKDMRMAGYPAKPRAMSWTAKGRWLATSGAEAVVLWPFQKKDGPMGKPGGQIGVRPHLVTAVAAHPSQEVLAAGYGDGTVLIIRMSDGAEVVAADSGGGAVTAIAWHPKGDRLAFGGEEGRVGIMVA